MNAPHDLLDIAAMLGDAYERRSLLATTLRHAREDLAALVVEITPTDGWDGKNAEVRELNMRRTLAGSVGYQKMLTHVDELQVDYDHLQEEINGLEADRRALEWTVRAKMVDVLAGKPIWTDNQDETRFDDVNDYYVTNAVTEDVAAAVTDPAQTDLPF